MGMGTSPHGAVLEAPPTLVAPRGAGPADRDVTPRSARALSRARPPVPHPWSTRCPDALEARAPSSPEPSPPLSPPPDCSAYPPTPTTPRARERLPPAAGQGRARPTSGDKATLQLLGLDLTEHAGHDYVEVVLHTPAELRRWSTSGFEYDVVIPDLVARGVEIAEINEAYAASVARSPLPSGRTRLPHARRLQRRHDRAAEAPARRWSRSSRCKRPSLDGRTIYGVEIGQGVRQARTPARRRSC